MTRYSLVARGLVPTACALLAPAAAAQPPSSNLETIIVRAARLPLPLAASGSAVTVLDRDVILDRQIASVGELLRAVPGVAVSRAGGLGALSQVRMRGGEANHVAVYVDGIKLNDPAQSSEFDFAHLLSSDVETIEVVRGPQSALWGSDALSGVINVTTLRPSDGFDFGAQAEAGADDWRQYGASVASGGDLGRFVLSVNRAETEGINVSRAGDETDGYENTSINLGAAFDVTDAIEIDVRMRSLDAQSDFDGIDFGTGLPTDQLNTLDTEQLSGTFDVAASAFDGRWSHEVRLARLDTDNTARTENAFAATGYDLTISGAVAETAMYQTTFHVSESHRVTVAFERRAEEFVQRGPIGFGDPNRDEQMQTSSRIIEYEGQLASRLSLLMSWRGDDNSDFADASTLRVTAAIRVGSDDRTKLRVAYGEGVKHPTFTERFGYYTDFLGNPALRPETSESWEIGFDHAFAGRDLALAATAFDETLVDEIDSFVFDPVSGGFTALNEDGESRRRGLELESRWAFREQTDFALSYTWLDADEPDATGGRTREIRRAEHIASANLHWSLLASRLDLNFHVDYNGEQSDVYFPPVPPFQERVMLDAFTLLGIAARFRLARAVELYGRIENALDDDYEEVLGYATPGRAVYVGLRYRLPR